MCGETGEKSADLPFLRREAREANASHALFQADCLLTRDFGVYKRWFKELRLADSTIDGRKPQRG